MSEPTKSCNLSEGEIKSLIKYHCSSTVHLNQYLIFDIDTTMERLNYLHKRLKTFKEPETVKPQPIPAGAWPTNG